MKNFFASLTVIGLAATAAGASPILSSAKVTQVQNEVRLQDSAAAAGDDLDPAPPRNAKAGADRAAKIGDVVAGKRTLSTGKKSRAELLFNDNTVARLGANSVFSFKPGSRDIDLKSGFLLLHTPKGQGGANIKTPTAAASVLGTTVMVGALPGGGMKMVVLEGTASVDYGGITQKVEAGQLVFLTQENGMSPPITVDLQALVASSGMVKNFNGTIGSEKLIQAAIKEQADKIAEGELESSGFTIGGDQNGLNVFNAAALEALLNELNQVQQALSGSTADTPEDMSGSFGVSPPASIDFGAPIAVSDTGSPLPGSTDESGNVTFSGDRFHFTQGPPASLLNLEGATTATFQGSGASVNYLTSFNAIRFDNFQAPTGPDGAVFNSLNLIFSVERGSVGVFDSTFNQDGDLVFHAGGWQQANKGNVDVANSTIASKGTGGAGVLLNTASGNILVNQSEILLAAAQHGPQILLDAPGPEAAIHVQNSVIDSARGAVPGTITIPAHEVTLSNVLINAANSQGAANVHVLANLINITDTSITGQSVILGNNANSAVNFIGNNNFIYTSGGVDGLVINGTQTGVVNVGAIGQPETVPVGP
jgi:FecR-like protein